MDNDLQMPLIIFKDLSLQPPPASVSGSADSFDAMLQEGEASGHFRKQTVYMLDGKKGIGNHRPYRWEAKSKFGVDMDYSPEAIAKQAVQSCPQGLMAQLQEIQKHRVSRDAIVSFAENLTFLTGVSPSATPLRTGQSAKDYFNCSCTWKDQPVFKEAPTPCSCQDLARPLNPSSKSFSLVHAPRCQHYVAISYRWRNEDVSEPITITTDNNEQRRANAPASVLLRAATFAEKHGYQFLWCDQESISDEDLEVGIQAMDIVYERAAVCLAPLDIEISQQEQLDTLAEATIPGPYPEFDDWREWHEPDMSFKKLIAIANVMRMIAADQWFERSWIFQESTAAYATMLLIKYSDGLDITRWKHLGSSPGEIEVPHCALRLVICKLKAAFENYLRETLFLARRDPRATPSARTGGLSSDDRARIDTLGPRLKVTKTIGEYFANFVLHTVGQGVHGPRHICTALEACRSLAHRENSNVADRLAIISNLCNFHIRLESKRLTELGYGLSACVLCVSLLNGDLSLARLEDGIRYEDLKINQTEFNILSLSKSMGVRKALVDLETGPPYLSWAPRLVEGFTESRYFLHPPISELGHGSLVMGIPQDPGFGKWLVDPEFLDPFLDPEESDGRLCWDEPTLPSVGPRRTPRSLLRYSISFHGLKNPVHIEGWFWKHHCWIECSKLAKTFYRSRFEDDEWDRRTNTSDSPHRPCDLYSCCRMTDTTKLKKCFWDLIQWLLQEENNEQFAETLWTSLLRSCSEESTVDSGDTHHEPRRAGIRSVSFEEFSRQMKPPQSSSKLLPWPQFYIVQKIIHSGKIGVWKLSRGVDAAGRQKIPVYAFFPSCDVPIPIFTPRQTDHLLRQDEERLLLRKDQISWPVGERLHPDGTAVLFIHPTEETPGPIRGFWGAIDETAEEYAFH